MADEKIVTEGEAVADPIDPIAHAELVAEVARLKAFHDEILVEKKAETDKRKAAETKAEQAKAEAEGDYKKLLELKDAEIKERDNKLLSYDQEKKEQKVMDAARKLSQELAKTNPAKAALLAKELRARLVLTEDGIKVTDETGKMVSDKIETLADYAKKHYDFLCDGLQSTGGAGVVVGKPTGTQNSETMNPADRMNRARGIE